MGEEMVDVVLNFLDNSDIGIELLYKRIRLGYVTRGDFDPLEPEEVELPTTVVVLPHQLVHVPWSKDLHNYLSEEL